jgi:hypothetical protein
MTINLKALKAKENSQTEYIGARVSKKTKARLEEIIKAEKVKSTSVLINELVCDFINTYTKQKESNNG